MPTASSPFLSNTYRRTEAGAVAHSYVTQVRDFTLTPEDFGAKGDGATDDRVAFSATTAAAAATGRRIQLGAKRYVISAPLTGTAANIAFQGEPGTVIGRITGGGNPAILHSDSGPYNGWSFDNVQFDAATSAADRGSYAFFVVGNDQGLIFNRCQFRAPGGSQFYGSRRIAFTGCDFYGTRAGIMASGAQDPAAVSDAALATGISFPYGCSDVRFERCRFHFCTAGISAGGSASQRSHGLTIRDCSFRADWWNHPYITYRFTITGTSSGAYVASGADFTSHFGGLQVCSLAVPIATGSAFNAAETGGRFNRITVTGTPFATARVGDVIETADGRRAEIQSIVSSNQVFTLGWEAVDTFEACAAPAQAIAWRLNRYYAASVSSRTSTSLTFYSEPVDPFTGERLLTDAGISPIGLGARELAHPIYSGVFLAGGQHEVLIEGSRFRGIWADQCAIQPDNPGSRVIGNDFRYGQDEGITCDSERCVIADNTFLKCGTSAILLGAADRTIVHGNSVDSWGCTNRNCLGAIQGSGLNLLITSNLGQVDPTSGWGGSSQYLIGLQVGPCTGTLIAGNRAVGARVADLYIESACAPTPHSVTAYDVATLAGSGIANVDRLPAGLYTPHLLATGASHTVDDVISMLQTIGVCKQS